jgi:hypothetical protein
MNIALKRLRNELVDFVYQVEQLKQQIIKSSQLKTIYEIDEHINSKNSYVNGLEAKLTRINNVNK